MDLLLAATLEVNPVPWARAQMAFTLAFHIILVPLGVSWAAMTLIANYRAIRRGDGDALRLAQRWSKYMAVTFAVGAVTGTVLSFEFGLLWPQFMGKWERRSAYLSPLRASFSSPRRSLSRSISSVGGGSSHGRISGPAYRSRLPASSAAPPWLPQTRG